MIGAPGAIACRRIEHRRQDLVVDLEPAAAFFGGGFAVGDDGRDLLADEAHDVVEHAGVVGIHPVLLVPRGREQTSRRILMRQHRVHAGHRRAPRVLSIAMILACGMRRAQQLDVQQAVDLRCRTYSAPCRARRRGPAGAGRLRPKASPAAALSRYWSCRRARPRSRDSRCSGRCCPSAPRRDRCRCAWFSEAQVRIMPAVQKPH